MDSSLPTHLAERIRWVVAPETTPDEPGEFVLYWMHNALRAHENPALDVAICIARQNGLPLLVYHGLSEDYAYASDRFHAFILQGNRGAQRELCDRGIRSVFHLQHRGNRGPHLRDLTRRAAVMVTEEMPVQPLAGWMERLVAKTSTPIAAIDASCIVPLPLLDQSVSRAFEYRDATKELYASRVDKDYIEQDVDCDMFQGDLPFNPVCLQDCCLSTLISKCDIDHAVAPVADTPGGSRAGYQRWERFKKLGLADYEIHRNDASHHEGVSRMSAYLHFGMVSPLRIAREASEHGAEKYLDELLIWRELSFHFCHHHLDVIDSIDAVPPWARETLREHAADQRDATYSWETLSRAKSGQRLWDACQQSLLRHGELHNSVRMTWGKAFLPWTGSPCRALQLTLDLNHRYALDGRDPSSYGGVLWCYGLFDRPFKPTTDILGSIRPRPLEHHENRLNVQRFQQIVDRPLCEKQPRVGVIGAGIAGLAAARTLADHGLQVTVFDKSRGVGGRLATRRRDSQHQFDHGAQYFTARDPRFSRYVQSWVQDGVVAPWMGRIVELKAGGNIAGEKLGTPRYVGVPGMNGVAKHLAADLDVRLDHTITKVQRDDDAWSLKKLASDQDDRRDLDSQFLDSQFDVLIVNCPAPQAAELLGGHSEIAQQAASVQMQPCWAVMLVSGQLADLKFDGAFINEGPLSWIARDTSKPGRCPDTANVWGTANAWVLHASPKWSAEHLELSADEVLPLMLEALEKATGVSLNQIDHAVAHRWRYAIPANPLQDECLWDPIAGLGACGDWCGGPRVEGAFLSGMAMAGTILRHITIDRAAYRPPTRMVLPSLLG